MTPPFSPYRASNECWQTPVERYAVKGGTETDEEDMQYCPRRIADVRLPTPDKRRVQQHLNPI